jgi:hypothetical protein
VSVRDAMCAAFYNFDSERQELFEAREDCHIIGAAERGVGRRVLTTDHVS